MTTGSSRILLDIPCKVCQDHSSGKHYGIFACDGCAGFFKRSIRRGRQYVCKNRGNSQEAQCVIDKTHRNQCRACRLSKCAQIGMNKDAVQHERGPRNSTLRRQMALYFKESTMGPSVPEVPMQFAPRPVGLPTMNMPFGSLFPPPAPIMNPCTPFPFLSPFFGGFDNAAVPKFGPPPSNLSPLFVTPTEPQPSSPFTKIPPPSCSTSPQSQDNVSAKEQAARILFMTINYPKSLPQFLSLPQEEQLAALRDSWAELFVLAASQFRFLSESWLSKTVAHSASNESLRIVIGELEQLRPDAVEYSCLRALILLRSANPVAVEQVQMTLARYEQLQHHNQPLRSVKLLMLMSALRSVKAEVLENLFFKDSIGEVSMSRLVCDLYSSAPSTVAQNFPEEHSSPNSGQS